MSAASAEALIARKRDGGEHSREELRHLVLGYAREEIPDHQMAAWLMAVVVRGMTRPETVWMTEAMVDSGSRVDLSGLGGVTADKHSTGGVADTTTLILAPLVAACGVRVAKMSGRGLGHTGGTLDKLEAIPGMRVDLSADHIVEQAGRVGVVVAAQSDDIVPADRRIYALRDVTATVASIPLITSSIISKKVAGGADVVVLDVKVGSGAFMKAERDARELAEELTAVGSEMGLRVECVLTDMDSPLGDAVGNALEVAEAIAVLRGGGPPRLREVCLELGARMLRLAGSAETLEEGRRTLEFALESGAGLAKFREWVEAQGGDPGIADEPSLLPRAPVRSEVVCERRGFVTAIEAETIGRAAMRLGAGRETKDAVIDPAAGVVMRVRVGDEVEAGSVIAELHTSDASKVADAASEVSGAVALGDKPPEARPLVVGV